MPTCEATSHKPCPNQCAISTTPESGLQEMSTAFQLATAIGFSDAFAAATVALDVDVAF